MPIRFSLIALLIFVIPTLGLASTETPTSSATHWQRPTWKFIRHQEDWSVLKNIQPRQALPIRDRIKFIPLNQNASRWASFGVHMRMRLENWSNFAFAAPPQHNDTFLLWRMTGHSDLHWGNHYRLYLEAKSALATDRNLPGDKRPLDIDTLALQQAFIDFKYQLTDATSLTIRPGRQELLFGKQRLISPLPWGNSLRSWDGINLLVESNQWHHTAFWNQFAPVNRYGFNNTDSENIVFGLYSTYKLSHAGLDLYWLGIDRKFATFNGSAGKELRHTLGTHINGKIEDALIDYDVEIAYQLGHVGSADVSAYMIASQIGHIHSWKGKPRLYLGFDYASGDNTVGGNVETFNQLFPLGHAYLGFIDLIGRQNIIDFSQGIALKLLSHAVFKADSHVFWRASHQDALYNPGSGTVRTGNSGSSSFVGNEIDLTLKYTFSRYLNTLFGYSHFFAGDFVSESGKDDGIDFIYAQAQYTF